VIRFALDHPEIISCAQCRANYAAQKIAGSDGILRPRRPECVRDGFACPRLAAPRATLFTAEAIALWGRVRRFRVLPSSGGIEDQSPYLMELLEIVDEEMNRKAEK